MDLEALRKKFPGGVLREKHPYYMADAIGDIPACLKACMSHEVLTSISSALGDFRPARVITVGCGTSYNACEAAAYFAQNLLHVPAAAYDAYDFEIDTPPNVDRETMVIGISESGQSITTCLSIEKAREMGAFTVGVSAKPGSRLNASAELGLADPFLHEIPLGKTRTYLSTALLGLLPVVLSQPSVVGTEFLRQMRETAATLETNLPGLAEQAKAAAAQLPAGRLRYIVTGFGAQKVNADEIRLKLMEVLGESATSFALEEFMHGPSACFDSDTVVILMQTDPRTLAKSLRIAQGVTISKASLVIISDQQDAGWPQGSHVIALPQAENGGFFGMFPAAAAAQYLIYALALKKGFNPDVNLEDINPDLGKIYAFFFPPGTH